MPNRIGDLIKRIEAGETVTQADVDRIATLQSLDIAEAGRQFIEDTAKREAEHTAFFRTFTEANV